MENTETFVARGELVTLTRTKHPQRVTRDTRPATRDTRPAKISLARLAFRVPRLENYDNHGLISAICLHVRSFTLL